MADVIDAAIQKVQQIPNLPPVPKIPNTEVLIDTDLELIKQRKIAQAQNIEAELAAKKLELLQGEFLKTLIPPVPPVIGNVVGLLKKARGSIKDVKLKAKQEIAKKKKELTEKRQTASRQNIERSAKTYKFPIKPK